MINPELIQTIIADRQRDIERDLHNRQLVRSIGNTQKNGHLGVEGSAVRPNGLVRAPNGSR
jgi:hypothetical protein